MNKRKASPSRERVADLPTPVSGFIYFPVYIVPCAAANHHGCNAFSIRNAPNADRMPRSDRLGAIRRDDTTVRHLKVSGNRDGVLLHGPGRSVLAAMQPDSRKAAYDSSKLVPSHLNM